MNLEKIENYDELLENDQEYLVIHDDGLVRYDICHVYKNEVYSNSGPSVSFERIKEIYKLPMLNKYEIN